MKHLLSLFLVVLIFPDCKAQNNKMDFEKYDPVSTLVVPEHKLTRAKFPFIDVHNHQWNMGSQDLGELVKDMDKLNMKVMINLSGGNGSGLATMTHNVKDHYLKQVYYFRKCELHRCREGGMDGRSRKAVGRRREEWRKRTESI